MVLDQKELSRILETTVVAAHLAGQHAMEQFSFSPEPSKKKDFELVTPTDSQCQQIIIQRIKETYPDHGFIAEEGPNEGIFKQAPRGSEQIWWIIDPIDGTNNFARGMLLFTVSIAAMYQNEPVVGVIFEPATDSMFTCVKGGNAQLNGRRIQASSLPMDKFSSIGLDSLFVDSIPNWVEQIIRKTRFRNLGSLALQMAYVAKGGLLATIAGYPKIWDIAAGALLISCAGGLVTDWEGKKIFPVDLDSYQGHKLPMLSANKTVHAELLSFIKS